MPRRNGRAGYDELFPGSGYSDDEWAFIRAVAAYQKRWGRRYPSWREILFVLHCLGYRKVAPAVPADADLPTAAEAKLIRAAAAGKPDPDTDPH